MPRGWRSGESGPSPMADRRGSTGCGNPLCTPCRCANLSEDGATGALGGQTWSSSPGVLPSCSLPQACSLRGSGPDARNPPASPSHGEAPAGTTHPASGESRESALGGLGTTGGVAGLPEEGTPAVQAA